MHKDYKMSKQVKTMLALMPFKTSQDRSSFKKSMIEADVIGQRMVKESQKSNKDTNTNGE